MDALTLDQIRVFLSVVDEGSFPKAAKSLNSGSVGSYVRDPKAGG